MKIIVCVAPVFDPASSLALSGGQINTPDSERVINPWDEFAVEAALQLKDEAGGEVTALSVGAGSARDALKHALAMGCDDAVWVETGEKDINSGLPLAEILAAAVQRMGEPGLVFFGRQAADFESRITAVQTARRLGWPVLTLVSKITSFHGGSGILAAERSIEEGRQQVTCSIPAVVSINKDFGEPRFPSFMGKRKADRATIPAWSLSDLGISAGAGEVEILGLEAVAARSGALEMIQGGTPEEMAAALVEKLLAEGVL